MSGEKRTVTYDHVRGYRRLDPLPTEDELSEFYERSYYTSTDARHAPDLDALVSADERSQREREWRHATVYPDLLWLVNRLGVDAGLAMDVGCGTGEMIEFLDVHTADWSARGVEIAPAAVDIARARGVLVDNVRSCDLGVEHHGGYDLVTLLHVLEHVRDPESVLRDARRLLRSGGVVVVQVPNDFSPLQEAARELLASTPWWIADPDHVNYFSFETLETTLSRVGFASLVRYTTFPMEFFVLTGTNYVGNPVAGAEAHRRRREFELAISPPTRRELYTQLAAAGVGRSCIIAGMNP